MSKLNVGMKYVIFSYSLSGDEGKRGVEFCQSTCNASEFGGNSSTEVF